jgi:Tfp pilus assembly protein PilN
MNAVNLIPSDSRRRRGSVSLSPPTLALVGGLAVALVAAILYVSAVNQVTARKTELAGVTASSVAWSAAANSYAPYVMESQQHAAQLADARQLAVARYPWSHLLSQVGGLMPAKAALVSLSASTPTAGSATPSTASTTSSPTSVSPTSGPPLPTVQLAGCAASQATVAQTMVQLHQITGVSAVTLASSTDSSANGASGGGGPGGTGSAGCPYRVQFQVSLTFAPSSPPAATPTAGAPAAAATSPAATSSAGAATTSPATTPATTSTGAVQ